MRRMRANVGVDSLVQLLAAVAGQRQPMARKAGGAASSDAARIRKGGSTDDDEYSAACCCGEADDTTAQHAHGCSTAGGSIGNEDGEIRIGVRRGDDRDLLASRQRLQPAQPASASAQRARD